MPETVQTNKSPMHITCTVGQPYGNPGNYSCGFHTGMDFPQSGTSEQNPDLYSCVEDGEVVYTYKNAVGNGESPDLGNQVQIFDRKNNVYFRYCHMLEDTVSVNVGDNVNTSTFLGKMRKHR